MAEQTDGKRIVDWTRGVTGRRHPLARLHVHGRCHGRPSAREGGRVCRCLRGARTSRAATRNATSDTGRRRGRHRPRPCPCLPVAVAAFATAASGWWRGGGARGGARPAWRSALPTRAPLPAAPRLATSAASAHAAHLPAPRRICLLTPRLRSRATRASPHSACPPAPNDGGPGGIACRPRRLGAPAGTHPTVPPCRDSSVLAVMPTDPVREGAGTKARPSTTRPVQQGWSRAHKEQATLHKHRRIERKVASTERVSHNNREQESWHLNHAGHARRHSSVKADARHRGRRRINTHGAGELRRPAL